MSTNPEDFRVPVKLGQAMWTVNVYGPTNVVTFSVAAPGLHVFAGNIDAGQLDRFIAVLQDARQAITAPVPTP